MSQLFYQVGTPKEIKALVDRMVLKGLSTRSRPLKNNEQEAIIATLKKKGGK